MNMDNTKENTMSKIFKGMLGVMLLVVGMLAGCGSGGSGDVATAPAPTGTAALVASDLTVPATIYAVSSSGYAGYKFNQDGSLLASGKVTFGTPLSSTVGAWSIATDNKTIALVIPGVQQSLFTLTSKDASAQFWIMSDASGAVCRFYFDISAAQAWYASLQPQAPGAITTFTTATFAGKTLYYVIGGYYQQALFKSDGTVQASSLVTSGPPGAMTTIGTWSVPANGTMQLVNTSGLAITYTLVSDDITKRYYRTTKTSSGSTTSVTVGLFYDQTTALSQAQAFTAAGTQP
jgi:hypothetical protein